MKTLTEIQVVQIGEAVELHWKEDGQPCVYRLAETASVLGQAFALVHAETLQRALSAGNACWYGHTDQSGSFQRHLSTSRHEAHRMVECLQRLGDQSAIILRVAGE